MEAYLPKCFYSLAAQSFPEVKFFLIDAGSTNGSGQIADSYYNADKRLLLCIHPIMGFTLPEIWELKRLKETGVIIPGHEPQ